MQFQLKNMTKRQKTATIISGSILALFLCFAGINWGLLRNNELRHILQAGKVTVVMDECSWSMMETDSGPAGFHYELAKAFADSLGVKLDIHVINGLDAQIKALQDGQCSFVAQFVPKTTCYGRNIAYMEPFELSRLMLVQRRDTGELIISQRQLDGKTLTIPQNKTMRMRIEHLSDEVVVNIAYVEVPDATIEDLVRLVAEGECQYTVCSAMQARILKQRYGQRLDFSLPLGFTQQYAWVLNRDARDLYAALSDFLQAFMQTPEYRDIYVRYFYADTSD